VIGKHSKDIINQAITNQRFKIDKKLFDIYPFLF